VAVASLNHERDYSDIEPWRAARVNVGRFERWLSMAAGGALAAYALRRRSIPGSIAALAGAGLLYRGATGHCDVYQALGVNRAGGHGPRGHGTGMLADRGSDTRRKLGGSAGIHVEESVLINKPVSQLYRFWRDFENLPTFMNHLESVAVREEGVSHWVVRGPAGSRVEWDARIINDIDNKLIAWQSLEGSMVSSAGSVNFREAGRDSEVRVNLQYSPPAGKLGAAVARMLGEEPHLQIHEDLRRFKQLMETGKILTDEG
jgi:uncharacterized membrane protein